MFKFCDGGREESGYKGFTGDCVVRSIAVATGISYKKVYNELFIRAKDFSKGRCKVAKEIKKKGASPRNGVHKKVYEKYLFDLGFEWVSKMKIGSGCTVHLKKDELPSGKIIVSLSKHLATVIDGILYDIYDCSRNGTRCVYGYYILKKRIKTW